jgi:hypothetical protein
MGEIIKMSDHAKPIPPKVTIHEHGGQRYTITYDPVSKRWVWIVNYVETYTYFGEANTAEAAAIAARRKIHNMNKSADEAKERDASR